MIKLHIYLYSLFFQILFQYRPLQSIAMRFLCYTPGSYKLPILYIVVCILNRELPDVQAGFRKGRGTRDQIAHICWIIEKAREFQKNIYFCFIDYAKAFDCVDHNKLENFERDGNTRPPELPLVKPICRSGSNS